MGEVIALLAIGAAVGGLVGTAISYDRGFRSGVKWAQRNIYGL